MEDEEYRPGLGVGAEGSSEPIDLTLMSRNPAHKRLYADFEEHTRGIGSKLLSKWGFAGRLGKNEKGLEKAIEVTVKTDRGGLGVGQREHYREATESAELEAIVERGRAGGVAGAGGRNVFAERRGRNDNTVTKYKGDDDGKMDEVTGRAIEAGLATTGRLGSGRGLILDLECLCESSVLQGAVLAAWSGAVSELWGFSANDAVPQLEPFLPFLCDDELASQMVRALGVPPKLEEEGLEEAAFALRDAADRIFLAENVALRAGIRAIINAAQKEGWRVGVVSHRGRAVTNGVLKAVGMDRQVRTVVTTDSLTSSVRVPPYPGLVSEAASRLQVVPHTRCVFISSSAGFGDACASSTGVPWCHFNAAMDIEALASLEAPESSSPCAPPFSCGGWAAYYRGDGGLYACKAEWQSPDGEYIGVTFIDYGNFDIVHKSWLSRIEGSQSNQPE